MVAGMSAPDLSRVGRWTAAADPDGLSTADRECLTEEERELYDRALAVLALERTRHMRAFSPQTEQRAVGEFLLACQPFAPNFEVEAVICHLLGIIQELRKARREI
jgi:hypothetical protein